MTNSIKIRLVCWHVGILLTTLLVFSTCIYILYERNLANKLSQQLQAILQTTVTVLSHEEEEYYNKVDPNKYLAEHSTLIDHLVSLHSAIAIFDEQGKLIAQKATSDARPLIIPRFELPNNLENNILDIYGSESKTVFRVLVKRVILQPSKNQRIIVVGEPLEANYQSLFLLRKIFLFTIPLVIFLSAISGWFLVNKSLTPVVAISEMARKIGANNLTERFQINDPKNEFGHLATTFNQLLSRLETAFAQQRHFMVDAAHELRTPLSIINTATEVTIATKNPTQTDYQETLKIINQQVCRLIRIVEDLFLLARNDATSDQIRHQSFYLDELIVEVVSASRVLASKKNITIITSSSYQESPFCGDEALLKQMLMNLLDNAIKYTFKGKIEVGFEQKDNNYIITVSDTGIGIPIEAQAFIFERFYRVDKSHSRTDTSYGSGAGLGLAIVRWIVEAHQGKVELTKSDNSGSVFTVSLPVTKPTNNINKQQNELLTYT